MTSILQPAQKDEVQNCTKHKYKHWRAIINLFAAQRNKPVKSQYQLQNLLMSKCLAQNIHVHICCKLAAIISTMHRQYC